MPAFPLSSESACRSLSATSIVRDTLGARNSLFTPPDNSKPFFATTPIFYVNAGGEIQL